MIIITTVINNTIFPSKNCFTLFNMGSNKCCFTLVNQAPSHQFHMQDRLLWGWLFIWSSLYFVFSLQSFFTLSLKSKRIDLVLSSSKEVLTLLQETIHRYFLIRIIKSLQSFFSISVTFLRCCERHKASGQQMNALTWIRNRRGPKIEP